MPSRIEHFRVRWIDTDASGRIHFSAAFRWMEVAEIELFRELNLMENRERYPRRHVEAEFLRPMWFDDWIEFELHVDQIGRSSITLAWEAKVDDVLTARGRQTIVLVDSIGRATPLPDAIRKRLEGVG